MRAAASPAPVSPSGRYGGEGLVAEAAQDVVGAAGDLAGDGQAARFASMRAATSA
jgi:hypothetical protein